MTIMYTTSHIADGTIYIFMHNRVKRMLYRKLNKLPYFDKKWKSLVRSRSATSEWSTESMQSSRRQKSFDGMEREDMVRKLSSFQFGYSLGQI